MPPRSPFRMVAPLALVLAVGAVWLLAAPSSDDPASRPTAGTTTVDSGPKRRLYTVRRGDNLASVAARFGVDVDRLIELNPQVDPQVLTTGQRIKLRPRD
jgi:LysM repeat protein